jgi:hypothetical protein
MSAEKRDGGLIRPATLPQRSGSKAFGSTSSKGGGAAKNTGEARAKALESNSSFCNNPILSKLENKPLPTP